MNQLFEQYKHWRELLEKEGSLEDDFGDDRKAFMKYAGLKKLDYDDFEQLELQYDEYFIELETEYMTFAVLSGLSGKPAHLCFHK